MIKTAVWQEGDPTFTSDDDVAGRSRGSMRHIAARAALALAVLAAGACGNDPQPRADSHGLSDCDQVAEETADLVIETADHAASSEGGLPPRALDVQHPDDFDHWDLVAALAEGSEQLEGRVEAASQANERLGCPAEVLHDKVEVRVKRELSERGDKIERRDSDGFLAMNLMAIALAAFRPPPSSEAVPAGFPDEFPIHPDAQQLDADRHQDGSVSATWQVLGQDTFTSVADFYQDALQEGRLGGWHVSHNQGSSTQSLDGTQGTGERRLQVAGYSFTGDVHIASENPNRTTITVRLTPEHSR